MPRGVPLTPEQIAEAARLYAETGNASEVARQMGLDDWTITRALRAAGERTRAELHTHALARAERDARRALVTIRKRLVEKAEEVGDVKDLAALAAQVHDNARATTQMRVAHAKLTGEHAAEKHAHTVDADDVLAGKLARLVAASGTGEDPR